MNTNPYNPLEPTTDATRFYGRRHAFAFFQRHLAGAINEKALVVLGQRGIGKSSLLSQIPLHIDERYVPIWIDVSQLDLDDEVGLVATIVDQTRAAMESVEASTYRLPDFPNPAEVELLTWLADEFLDIALTAIRRERHLVMMIDEAQLLFDAVAHGSYNRDFFHYLQNLLVQHERLDIVATLDILYETDAIKTSPFDDTTLHYRLLQLDENDALELIQEPVKDVLLYEAGTLRKLEQLAGGHPFHIHSLCRLLFRLAQERNESDLGLAEIDAVYTAALEQAGDVVEPLWARARPNERLCLTALVDLRQHNPEDRFPMSAIQDWLAGTEFPLNQVQLGAALRGLEYMGLVQSDEHGNYHFASGIQGDWLLRYTDILSEEKTKPPVTLPAINRQMILGGAIILILVVVFLALLLNDGSDDSVSSEDVPPTTTLVPNITPTPPPTKGPPVFQFGG
jgi:hypothetical protein